uniref:Uncharacterized protein n=1 Tax=Salmo trutta TaxID=8032 RepID=A0A674F2Y3_SALTR
MASDGMILTNHDHQIRVGVLTGKCKIALILRGWSAPCSLKPPYFHRTN